MKYALIKQNVVENIVVASSEYALENNLVEITGNVSKGWTYDGEKFSAPVENIEDLANQARTERNKLLSESDWTQVADAPVDKAAWATYRQALRDVPNQTGFPSEITWPDAP
jgi:hypothetical protein